jgi:hypothetical protein
VAFFFLNDLYLFDFRGIKLKINKTPATNVNKTKTQGLIGGRVCLMIVYVTDADFIKMFSKSVFR